MSKKYPLHEKLRAIKELHQDVSEFCEWLEMQGYEICKVDQERAANALTYIPYISYRPEKIISEFLDIDPAKLEAEKQEMLKEFRARETKLDGNND